MHISKSKILQIYPLLLFLKQNTAVDPGIILDVISLIRRRVAMNGDSFIHKIDTICGIKTPPLGAGGLNGFESLLQSLLQPLTKPHFRYHNLWFVSWRLPFVRIKILKENLSDLVSEDYAFATISLIMYNSAITQDQSNPPTGGQGGLSQKLQSQFIGHTITGAWWRLSDETRYKVGLHIIKRHPELAMYLSDYYADSLEKVMRMYPDVFNADHQGRTLYQNGEGCLAMLEEIAAQGTYGDYEKVSKLPVHNLFVYLKHQAIKVKAEQSPPP